MPDPSSENLIADLVTLRDWLRYGVTRMTRAKVVFGHGTETALDEAAFLILSALDLPIDTLEPWLECRLTQAERRAILSLIEARIATRKPAAYLTHAAYIQGRKFYIDERVIVPRSFIGELICQNGLSAAVPDPDAVTRVLDLCTGSGCLAILAAEIFTNATIDATDISRDALDVAARNVADYGLNARIKLHESDLFERLPAARYDVIISNPPYVSAASVAAFEPEYRAEPAIAHLGGPDGLDLVRKILDRASDYLAADGALVVEIGSGQAALEAVRPDLPFLWLDTAATEGEVFALQANDLGIKTHSRLAASKKK